MSNVCEKFRKNDYAWSKFLAPSKRHKKIHALSAWSFRFLPFAVALLLTVKNQVIHICHELVQRHCTSLLFSIFILIIRLLLAVCKAGIVIFL